MTKFAVLTFLFIAFSMAYTDVHAGPAVEKESFAGEVLCLPSATNPELSDGCLMAGPARYQAQMAKKGITFPPRPLPARQPDPTLIYVPYLYGRVTTPGGPVYASLDDAVNAGPIQRRFEPGFVFIDYFDQVVVDERRFYRLTSGGWMTASDVSRLSPANFQGLEFTRTPERPFGWILQPVEIKRTPGYQQRDYSGQSLNRYNLVQVYAVEDVNGEDWVLIGPDRWIERRMVAQVIPNTTPPEGVENGRWIEINLQEQTLAIYDQHRLVFATVIASGVPGTWTRPGLFQIYKMLEREDMQGSFTLDRSDYYSLAAVPWTLYFDQARALHGTYWHNGFGYPRSSGCVNLSTGDSRWVFDWAEIGDWVYVWDPSGQTPTDPELYGAGGA
ncbi:MAG: L,D-transpeptidase [Anaerolineales bacterium]|nr:L,D-transpeptidase [Anaerolineales bacterium]